MEEEYEKDIFAIEVNVKHPDIEKEIKTGAMIKKDVFDSDREQILDYMLSQIKLDILNQIKEEEKNGTNNISK